jgi:hypothetical protein
VKKDAVAALADAAAMSGHKNAVEADDGVTARRTGSRACRLREPPAVRLAWLFAGYFCFTTATRPRSIHELPVMLVQHFSGPIGKLPFDLGNCLGPAIEQNQT